MNTFKATIKKFPFNKTYRCKGHELVPHQNMMVLTLDDETRVFIPNKYIVIFDKAWFEIAKKRAEIESQGKAKIG